MEFKCQEHRQQDQIPSLCILQVKVNFVKETITKNILRTFS